MSFQADSDCKPSEQNGSDARNGSSSTAEGNGNFGNQATISSTVQQLYELENGVFGTHLNHCGTSEWLWELQLVGPDIDVTLSVGIPISSLRGSVDSVRIHEVYDERLTPANSADDATGHTGEPKVQAWLCQLVDEETSDASSSLCDYAEAIDSLELALSLQSA